MDFTAVSTAVALLAILLGWYALLEYEDGRWVKGAEHPKRRTGGDERGTYRARRRRPEANVTRQHWQSNGHHPSGQLSTPTRVGRRFSRRESYGLASIAVLTAYLMVALGDLLFTFPPFIFFAAAVALAFTLWGWGSGLLALLLATLLSDFFFVGPAFIFSMDWRVFRLSLVYLFTGLLSVFISRLLSARTSA